MSTTEFQLARVLLFFTAAFCIVLVRSDDDQH